VGNTTIKAIGFKTSFDNSAVRNALYTISPSPIPTPTPTPSATAIRINSGGPSYTDSLGQVWSADQSFVNGTTQTDAGQAVAGTVDDPLYRSERYAATLKYQVPVANGTYEVTLYFAEMYFAAAGARVFNVSLEGQTVLQNFDIWAVAGKYAAVTRTYSIKVSDGVLNIVGTASVNNAKFSALEIRSSSGTSTPTPTPTPTPTATPSPTPSVKPSVKLSWDASTGPDVSGYRVRYGQLSGSYPQTLDVGIRLSWVIANLNDDTTYYFVVVAYNSAGVTSLPSNEVTSTTPAITP
jgi:hypothetical protein